MRNKKSRIEKEKRNKCNQTKEGRGMKKENMKRDSVKLIEGRMRERYLSPRKTRLGRFDAQFTCCCQFNFNGVWIS